MFQTGLLYLHLCDGAHRRNIADVVLRQTGNILVSLSYAPAMRAVCTNMFHICEDAVRSD